MSAAIRELDSASPRFEEELARLLDRGGTPGAGVDETVRAIIDDVRRRGDEALLEYTARFDDVQASSVAELEVAPERLDSALGSLDPASRRALEVAAARVRRFHEHQLERSWEIREEDGTVLGQRVAPLDRAGLYAPGGKAAYPSSVLMTALPARVAGVAEIVLVVPAPRGEQNEMVLAAARLAGVDRVFAVGGAQAVAALAYGTATVPAVDKIVGPGNQYVAAAKRLVFGHVGIDMIAGPSEVVVVADGDADPEWVAMDLFAQAEHDEEAQSLLITADAALPGRVHDAIRRLLPAMERRAIIARALAERGALVRVRDLDEAAALVNRIAPEHLELMLADARGFLEGVRHAGAVFLGPYSAEVMGDYCAGPNHVLPTAGTARFSSPLGVYDFLKRTSIIECSAAGGARLAATAAILADAESLTAHARSARLRMRMREGGEQ